MQTFETEPIGITEHIYNENSVLEQWLNKVKSIERVCLLITFF